MKPLTRALIAILIALASTSAIARSRVHFGVHFGPYWGPWWAVPAPIYYPTPVVVEREPLIIIEHTSVPIDYWYFCRPTNTYYPYVRDCASPWEKVPSQPAAQ